MLRFQAMPRMPVGRTGRHASSPALWLAPISMLWLAACATPLSVAPGTLEAQVVARFGPPSAEYRTPVGPEGVRLEYQTQGRSAGGPTWSISGPMAVPSRPGRS